MNFQDVENARKTYLEKRHRIWRRALILVGLAMLIAVVTTSVLRPVGLALFIGPTLFVAIFGLTITAAVVAFATSKDASAYKKAYKAHFVERTLAATFTNLRYDHATGLDRELLRTTGMVNTGDIYRSNDLTIAKYKDVSFIQADAHIETESTDSDGNTTYTTIFSGRFMIFEFPKKFDFHLEVIGKGFGAALIPHKGKDKIHQMRRIHTESSEFDRAFKVYAEDGFETYYLLAPDIIHQMLEIGTRFKNRLLFGFLENTLLIGVSDGKDSFEPPSPRRPIDEKAEFNKVQADIKVITDFVDLLKLDKKRQIFRS